jgi:hypothetical protein
MLSFLNEDYAKVRQPLFQSVSIYIPVQSEQELTLAFYHCHVGSHSNQESVPLLQPLYHAD